MKHYPLRFNSCILLLASTLFACAPSPQVSDASTTPPKWLQRMLQDAQNQPHNTLAIYSIKHNGQTYYLRTPSCCDRFSELYNQQGQFICAPSGGFTGQGDGKCGGLDIREAPTRQIWPQTKL